ncbi:hypothetical protein EC991_008853 [Linnemannia zychae]|nr:hypothetical protein EC991_008853 [Linnemannia zychae]
MEPVPSNAIQLIASDICAEDPVMSDKFARDQIEQVVVNVLNELQLKARIAEGLNGIALSGVRGLLYNDPDISDSAKHFKLDPDSRFLGFDENISEFLIHPDHFQLWREKHQRAISTNFVLSRNYKYCVADQYRLSYRCQCAGQKEVRKGTVKGGKSGKPRMRTESIKKGCPSRIHALFKPIPMADGFTKPGCVVEYHYQHNHPIGDITDLDTRQKSIAIKAIIERLLNQGSTIQRVMQQLTTDHDKFTLISRRNEEQLSRDDFITFDDVYNIWHRVTTAEMRKDPNPILSAIKWMEDFDRNNAFNFYDKDDKTSGMYFGFASLWQLQQLKTHGRTICFDGTHNVFGHATNLFTLIVKNSDTGLGIPVAFLVTKTEDAFILSNWLLAIRRKMRDLFSTQNQVYEFLPDAIITDQGGSVILAMKTVFPGVPISYCAWHVLRLLSDLRKILYERSNTTAQQLIGTFRETWSDQKELVAYLDESYFGGSAYDQVKEIQESWMLCYRQHISYASIDTNNYIESWHNTLKRHFLRDKQQQPPDTIIYILAVLAVPHFQQKCIGSNVNVGRVNPIQLKEPRLTALATEHIKTREARGFKGAFIKQKSDVILRVESFTDPTTIGYDVKIDFSKSHSGHIVECSCKYFYEHKSCCKHIALVQMELPLINFVSDDVCEHQTNSQPEVLEACDSTAEADPEEDLLSIYIQRLVHLDELRDKKADFPLKLEILTKLKELLDLAESSFTLLPDQNLNKRQRQH